MRPITVDKAQLLAKVEGNRALHRTVFKEAVEGYKERAVRELEVHIERVKRGRIGYIQWTLPIPVDHTKDYDNAIEMIKMSLGATIEIDEQAFNQFVRDDWTWKREFVSTSMNYSATSNAAYGGQEEDDE